MQRSSYNNQTLSNISLQGDRTQNQIAQARRGEEAALAGQRSLAAQQLAQQLAQYQQANQSQVAAYADQLRAEDYQKRVAQDQYYNQLQTMLYEYGLQDSARAAASRGSSRGNKKPPVEEKEKEGEEAAFNLGFMPEQKFAVTLTPNAKVVNTNYSFTLPNGQRVSPYKDTYIVSASQLKGLKEIEGKQSLYKFNIKPTLAR